MARANAAGINLHHATLENTDMREFRGRGAVLAGAESPERRGPDLTGADLRESNLAGSRLAGARMEGAKLEGASRDGAKLPRSARLPERARTLPGLER